MPSVLHVSLPTQGGVAVYVAALCADQRARGWDVTVACPDGGALPRALAAYGVRQLAWQARRSPGADTASEVRRLRTVLDRVGPDVLHLHSAKAGLAGRLAARGALPTVFQPHGWSWLAAGRGMTGATVAWERLAARWTSLFLCVGAGEAAQGRARGIRGRYSVVRNGVDLTRFVPAGPDARDAARIRLSLPPDAPLVVCVGRVTRQKGQDVLLAAWPGVRDRHPDAVLAIVGTGDLLEPLRRKAPAGVLFPGEAGDPLPWYAAADVVVLPSRWEGLPLTLLEALAVGRPVVGSDIPGIAEALPDDTGARVPVEDAAALADAVAYRLADGDPTQKEGRAAARYAAANADIRRTYDRVAEITAWVANTRPPARTPAGTRSTTEDSSCTGTRRAGSSP